MEITIGTGIDNLAKGSTTAADNLALPLTNTSASGTLSGTLIAPGGDINVASTNGFPDTVGVAHIRIGASIVEFNYATKTIIKFEDCYPTDEASHAFESLAEVFLEAPRSL